jgi:serine/threonine protein phosphatase PrpC
MHEHRGHEILRLPGQPQGRPLKNEDRMGYCYTRESGLFVLADGMGGHPEGEVAAQLALQTIAALYQREGAAGREGREELPALGHGRAPADHALRQRQGMLDTPRTTVVAAVLQGTSATWVHCGDSRLYVVRDGELLTRTRDHSYAERPAPGIPTADQPQPAVHLPGLARPSRCSTSPPPLQLQRGDRICCAPTAVGRARRCDIVHASSSGKPVSDAVPDLAEMALRKGGAHSDNVTVIALEWEMSGRPVHPRHVHRQHQRRRVRLDHPGRHASDTRDRRLDEDAIERSIAEINEAIRARLRARKS